MILALDAASAGLSRCPNAFFTSETGRHGENRKLSKNLLLVCAAARFSPCLRGVKLSRTPPASLLLHANRDAVANWQDGGEQLF